MKSIKFILITLAVLLLSCTSEEKDIFDDSAANRITADVKRYQKILKSAPNGWRMEFYAGEKSSKIGGYNILLKFEEQDRVTVSADILALSSVYGIVDDEHMKVSSLYSVFQEQSAVLTFNTYNKIIHHFTEPQGSPNTLKGDYEFIFIGGDENRLELKGKKFGNRAYLTPVDAARTWEEVLDKTNDVILNSAHYVIFKVLVDGNVVADLKIDSNRTFKFTALDGTSILSENATSTETGVSFYTPITIGGKEVQHLVWDQSSKTFRSDNNNIVLEGNHPEGYRFYGDYLGTYTFSYSLSLNGPIKKKTITIERRTLNNDFFIKGAFGFDAVASYNAADERIEIIIQALGIAPNGNTIVLGAWDADAGTFHRTGKHGMYSIEDKNAPTFRLTFRKNGSGYNTYGFILWQTTPSGGSGGSYTPPVGTDSRYVMVDMVKQ